MIERRPPPRRGYVRVGEAQVHYRRAGPADSPALVLLHQTPSTSAMYAPLMRHMAGYFDLIALDTPGFGQSDALPGDFTVAAAAERLAAAVAQLRDGPCAWFGHHTGASLALQVAHDHPEQVQRLALSGPCLLGPNVEVQPGSVLSGNVVAGPGAVLASPAALNRVVLWGGTHLTESIPSNSVVHAGGVLAVSSA